MKGRLFFLLIGLVAGVCLGYLGARDDSRFSLNKLAAKAKVQGQKLYGYALEKAAPAPKTPKAPIATAPAPIDKRAYLQDSLKLTDSKVTPEPGALPYARITGKVRNMGTEPVKEVHLMVFFVGSESTILDDARTEVLQGQTLAPWEERAFSVRIANTTPKWVHARASVIDIAL